MTKHRMYWIGKILIITSDKPRRPLRRGELQDAINNAERPSVGGYVWFGFVILIIIFVLAVSL